jgi:hypothetical protein
VFDKIGNVSVGKLAVLLAIVSVIFYFIFRGILVPKIMSSSIGIRIAKESAMDKEYRDKVLRQMYDSYQRKMAGRE